jgi:hypothetical protein
MKTINLFFLREGFYTCILTIKDEISKPFHEKITVELEEEKEWKRGLYRARMGVGDVDNIKEYDDTHFFYSKTEVWHETFGKKSAEVKYIAIPKALCDGRETETYDLSESINNISGSVFLFV